MKRWWFLLFIGFLCSMHHTYAQNEQVIDSLKSLLDTRIAETKKIDVLNTLGDIYSSLDSAQTASYADEAIRRSKKVNYQPGIVNATINLGYSQMVRGKYSSAMQTFKEALVLARENNYLEGEANILNNIGVAYHYVGEIDSTIQYFRESLEVKRAMKNNLEIAKGQSNMGAIFQYKGEYDSALFYFETAYKTLETEGKPRDRAMVIGNIGNIYYEQGDLEEAVTAFDKSRILFEEAGDVRETARIISNLGIVTSDRGNYPLALEYQLQALRLYQSIDDQQGASNCYHEMSNIAIRQQELDEALIHVNKAIEIRKNTGYLKGLSESYMNAGDIANRLKQPKKALNYLNSALEILEKIQDSRNTAASYINIGLVHLELEQQKNGRLALEKADSILSVLGDKVLLSQLSLAWARLLVSEEKTNLAIKKGEEAIERAKEAQFPITLRDASKLLSDAYEQKGDYRNAFEYQRQFKAMSDSLLNVENSKELARLESQYEYQKREELLKSEQARKELELQEINQRNLYALYGTVILIVFLVVVAALIYYQYSQRNKYARVVEDKNQQLSALMASKEKIFGVIAHDLKNPLSAFSNMSSALAENIDAFSKEDIKGFLEKFVKSTGDLRNLLNNLLQWSLSETDMLKVKPETLQLSDLAQAAVQPLNDYAMAKGIELKLEVTDEKALADKQMIETVVRNLVSNALKFTDQGGHVTVRSVSSGDQFMIEVEDTGIGMSADELGQLFNIQSDLSKVGDHEEKGTGIGLILCKELVEKNNGHLEVSSKPGEGTKFTFSIPKAA
jgi:signal transduction histidine kinase/Tfp pilus assembly protein PilF